MTRDEIYSLIDHDLEKLVYLFTADEGNHGLYELVWDLNRYSFLSIADKYLVASDLLIEIITEELVIIEEYDNYELKNKIRNIDLIDLEIVLNNPSSWYPSSEPICIIKLTEKGIDYLENLSDDDKKKLYNRLFNKIK